MSGTGIKGKQIADGTIESADIADGTIDSADIGNVSIGDLSDVTIDSSLTDDQLLVYNTGTSSFENSSSANINVGDVDFTSATMRGHIIPDLDNGYDIGSAEFKIRDAYISENSLWIGDNHKVDVDSSGKKKHRKRKKSSPPKSLRALRIAHTRGSVTLVGVDDAAKDLEIEAEVVTMFAGAPGAPANAAAVTLAQWIQYAQSIDGHGDPASLTVGDIFNPEEEDDWEEIIEDRPSMSAVVLTSPDGTRYLLTVSDIGVLSVDAEVAP